MATWSEWFLSSRKYGIPLDKMLPIDIERDLRLLRSSGLPVLDFIVIEGSEYSSSRDRISKFVSSHKKVYTRVYNKFDRSRRFYRLDISSADEFFSFIEGLDIDISQFIIQVFDYRKNNFGGNVISNGSDVYIEMIEGLQEWVGRSDREFYHGRISALGSLAFHEKTVPERIRLLSIKVLGFLRLSKDQYLKGYFEFIVTDNDQVFFLDWNDRLLC